ncbi:MAG: PhzF family phenazine biosynthesis protein [Chloroflexi bacterium]|nr:MAG: PhzF family phenazine biosynthesis protein [Chloroflexota bacterium]
MNAPVVRIHVVRVFLGTRNAGGNLLGVFLDGRLVPQDRRLAVTSELGFSESVFVDDAATGRIAIFVPAAEVPFAGHPTVGTAWLLANVGRPVDVLRVPAGEVPTWREDDVTWIRARPAWVDYPVLPRFVELPSVAEVDALPGQSSEPWLYAWAWENEAAGHLRSRSFPTWAGIAEDEASGAAAVLMGDRLHRALTIRQGAGSQIEVRTGTDRTIEVGGRCALVEIREHPL